MTRVGLKQNSQLRLSAEKINAVLTNLGAGFISVVMCPLNRRMLIGKGFGLFCWAPQYASDAKQCKVPSLISEIHHRILFHPMTTGDGNAKSKYRMFGASLNEQTSMEIKGYCSLAKVSQRMVLEHGFAMVKQTFQNSEKVPHDFSSAAGSCMLLVHVPPDLLQQIALFRTQHRLSNRDVLMHAFKVYSKAHPIFSLNDLQKW